MTTQGQLGPQRRVSRVGPLLRRLGIGVTKPEHCTVPEQKAAAVIQRIQRGYSSRKSFLETLRTVHAVLTIQRMQRGRATRRSLAQARSSSSSSSSSSQPASSSAPAAASDVVAPERSCRDDQSGAAPAPAQPVLEIAAAATLVVTATTLMQVDARVVQSSCRDSLDALDDKKAHSPRGSSDALDNAMKRLGPEALGGAQRPRPRPPYISRV